MCQILKLFLYWQEVVRNQRSHITRDCCHIVNFALTLPDALNFFCVRKFFFHIFCKKCIYFPNLLFHIDLFKKDFKEWAKEKTPLINSGKCYNARMMLQWLMYCAHTWGRDCWKFLFTSNWSEFSCNCHVDMSNHCHEIAKLFW